MWKLGDSSGDTSAAVGYVANQLISWTAPDATHANFYAVCGKVAGATILGEVHLATPKILFKAGQQRYNPNPPKYCPKSGTNPNVGCTYEEIGCKLENSGTKLNCRNQTIYGQVYIKNMPETIKIIDMSYNEISWINSNSWKKRVYKFPFNVYSYPIHWYEPYGITEIDLSHNSLVNVDDLIRPTVFPCPPHVSPMWCAYTLGPSHPDYGLGQRGLITLEKLNLQNNSISSMRYDVFEIKSKYGNSTLVDVNILNNPLDFLQANCILSKDTYTLSCNNSLPSNMKQLYFQDLPRVRFLDFSNNELESINPNTWAHSRSTLESIDISMNQILSIQGYTAN
jgi:hypothetical protein